MRWARPRCHRWKRHSREDRDLAQETLRANTTDIMWPLRSRKSFFRGVTTATTSRPLPARLERNTSITASWEFPSFVLYVDIDWPDHLCQWRLHHTLGGSQMASGTVHEGRS